MMSPYEGERIFEAEMVRLHQCDRTLYAGCARAEQTTATQRSWWQWFAQRFTVSPAHAPASSASPQRPAD